ncbi:MAG TPA: hypothetical protein VFM18_22180 [Methanosarcina sp.]|nr:hypothetical protein [Methanosarcina sp.]
MATNNILQFASSATNILSQVSYSTDGDRINGNGYTTAAARSALINKALYQSSTMSAVLAQLIVDQGGATVNDSDSVATTKANLLVAIRNAETVNDAGNAIQSNSGVRHLNYFTGTGTGIISLKIAGLVTATASTVDLGFMKVIITQDDRDHSSATNPSSYEFLIKGNMDAGVWYNTQAMCSATNSTTSINIRFTRTGTDAYIEIGDVGGTWYDATVDVYHVSSYIIAGYTPIITSTLQNSLMGTTATDSTIAVSGYASLVSPAFSGSPSAPTQTAGDNSTKLATTAYVDRKFTIGTAVTASGTAVDFTSIPSWVKRITVMFKGLSTNGASVPIVQIGSGTIQTSGYLGSQSTISTGTSTSLYTAGIAIGAAASTNIRHGKIVFENISGNDWEAFGGCGLSDVAAITVSGGSVSLSGTLDRIRITTVNGTDTFDAGTINIIYEG